MEINKGLTRTGRKNLSKPNGWIFLSGGECQQKQGLEIVALDEVNERYTLFDIPTTSSSIAQALREEAEELVFQWMHPEQSDIEEARQKWTKWITKHIVPYHGNPFEKTEAMGFTVEEQGKWYALMMQVPLQKLGVASPSKRPYFEREEFIRKTRNDSLPTDGIFEAYHMNKKHWISIALNVCSDDALVKECIYTATNVSQRKTILYFHREIRYNFQHSVLAKGDFFMVNIAIVGATGVVGTKMIERLEESNLQVDHLYLLASARSAGKVLQFRGKDYVVEELTEDSFKRDIDYAIFSAGGGTSLKFAPIAERDGVIVIDNSSAWRMDPEIDLVVPECNAPTLERKIIANPNCSTIQSVVPLRPLHDAFG